MSTVFDASALVAALIRTDSTGHWAAEILESGPAYTPEIGFVETANVIRRFELAGRISTEQADAAFDVLMDLGIQSLPFAPFADRIWGLRGSTTSYDAWYVAIAETLDLPLATLDQRLARTSGPACRFLLPPGTH